MQNIFIPWGYCDLHCVNKQWCISPSFYSASWDVLFRGVRNKVTFVNTNSFLYAFWGKEGIQRVYVMDAWKYWKLWTTSKPLWPNVISYGVLCPSLINGSEFCQIIKVFGKNQWRAIVVAVQALGGIRGITRATVSEKVSKSQRVKRAKCACLCVTGRGGGLCVCVYVWVCVSACVLVYRNECVYVCTFLYFEESIAYCDYHNSANKNKVLGLGMR